MCACTIKNEKIILEASLGNMRVSQKKQYIIIIIKIKSIKKARLEPGMVFHAFNPSTKEPERLKQTISKFEASLLYTEFQDRLREIRKWTNVKVIQYQKNKYSVRKRARTRACVCVRHESRRETMKREDESSKQRDKCPWRNSWDHNLRAPKCRITLCMLLRLVSVLMILTASPKNLLVSTCQSTYLVPQPKKLRYNSRGSINCKDNAAHEQVHVAVLADSARTRRGINRYFLTCTNPGYLHFYHFNNSNTTVFHKNQIRWSIYKTAG